MTSSAKSSTKSTCERSNAFLISEKLGLAPSDCVYVGDTEIDIQTARNAGMDCVTVTWGFRDEDQLLAAGAKYIAHDTVELEALLR